MIVHTAIMADRTILAVSYLSGPFSTMHKALSIIVANTGGRKCLHHHALQSLCSDRLVYCFCSSRLRVCGIAVSPYIICEWSDSGTTYQDCEYFHELEPTMDPTYPLVPIANFLGFVLTIASIFTSVRCAVNTPIYIYLAWLSALCFIHGLNAVIWHDNVNNSAPVWCDISE